MRNIILKVFLAISFFLISLNYAEAVSNPYGKYQSLYGITTVRCTWYAWDQAYKYTGVALPSWGNAQTWYNSAINSGYKVGSEAKANSIAVWSSSDGYGHVGFVVSVEGNYMIVNEGGIVTEENEGIINGSKKSTTAGNLIGFIYLDEAPTINNSKKNNNTSNTITNNSSNKIDNSNNSEKSNNNNLSNLTINIEGFTFNPEITNYTLEVAYETQIIKIEAISEDKLAVVTGTGEKALKVGKNNYKIIVTAEDKTTKEYDITINRKEELIEKNEEPKEKENGLKKYIILFLSSLIILITIIILIVKRKKGKNENK